MDLVAKLASLNLKLPAAPKPVAAYIPAVRTGNLVYVSGQLPMSEGQLIAKGPIPSVVGVEQGQAAARQCALNALAIVNDHLTGDWSRFVRVVRLAVFVASDNHFTEQPKVANGASELLGQLFGPAGQHARAAVGVNVLPLGASVEVELIVEIR
jgi:enamine deaminase RidA (YjgF/YER057c/UK114 family)